MKKYVLLFVLFSNLLFASDKFETLKFELIKESINFLASDSIVASAKDKRAKCETLNYDCLKKFCDDQKTKIKKGSKKIDEWNTPVNSKEDLKKLEEKILDDLTSSKEKKDYRTKLSGYKSFLDKLNEIINSYQEEPPQEKHLTEKSSQINPVETKDQKVYDDYQVPEVKTQTGWSGIIAIIISILAIALSIITFLKNINSNSNSLNGESNSDASEFNKMKSRINELNAKLEQKIGKEFKQDIEKKLSDFENKIIQSKAEQNEKVVELDVPQSQTENKRPPVIPDKIIKFAKRPDMSTGFSSQALFDSQNGEMIFEIEIEDNRASFTISQEEGPQKYVQGEFNKYLLVACEYSNQPSKNSRIITKTPGTLIKSSGNWSFQDKAIIEFK